jgi:hypothetical protein
VLRANGSGALVLEGIAEVERMVSSFKRYAHQSANLPAVTPIAEAVQQEKDNLGHVLFTLIGDLAPAAEGVVAGGALPGVAALRLDTSRPNPAQFDGTEIVVNNTHDEESIWTAVGGQLGSAARPVLAKLLEDLEDTASRDVAVPEAGTRPITPLLRVLCSGLETQALEYQEALDLWRTSGHSNDTALHQILRIAYNFASDAVRLIRLTLSVCDLKPLVFWCTVHEHLMLDVAIRALPWQTQTKASLGNYTKIVNSARNHAFHDLFPVISGLKVELPDAALRKIRLRLFAVHGSKRNRNEVQFEDQELVDLLTEFTRAGRRITPPDFWEKNLDAMEACLKLLEATTRSLVQIREEP